MFLFPKAIFFDVYSTLCCFVVYSTRRFVVCLSVCHFVLVFFSPFSIAITSLGEEKANLRAFRTFVRFVLVWICRFPLPLGVWERLRIVALPGHFSYLFLKLTFLTRNFGKYCQQGIFTSTSLREHVDSAGHIEKENLFIYYNPAECTVLREPTDSHSTALFHLVTLTFCSVFFVSKGNLFDVYFTTLQPVFVPCGGGRTSPRTLP